MVNTRRSVQVERYGLERSPLSQGPTQRDVGRLLGETRDDLRRLVNYKDKFIVRRRQTINNKERELAYPESRLRAVHERLKFHLKKIRQPEYIFSPRVGYGQRDNASLHISQVQFLSLDIKRFYPSTSRGMIKRCFVDLFGMDDDVAGLLAHLATVDDRASFGSPLTPVLCTFVHRPMFSEIAELCVARGLRLSIWVDDITISGNFVPGDLLEEVRATIRRHGLRSHKIEFRNCSRPVFITGIGVIKKHCVPRSSMNLKIHEGWKRIHSAVTAEEYDDAARTQLSLLGGLRYIYGPKSAKGRKVADVMNSLRQKRTKRISEGSLFTATLSKATADEQATDKAAIPF